MNWRAYGRSLVGSCTIPHRFLDHNPTLLAMCTVRRMGLFSKRRASLSGHVDALVSRLAFLQSSLIKWSTYPKSVVIALFQLLVSWYSPRSGYSSLLGSVRIMQRVSM